MNKFKFLPLLAAGAAFVGCNDFDYGVTADTFKQKEYAENFEKVFGTPDPNQDWSMAMLVEANVNLPEIKGTAKMNICTGDPRNSETRLLAQVMLQDGQAHLQFDAIKGSNSVFVSVEQNDEYKVFGWYAVVDGKLYLTKDTPKATPNATSITRVGVGDVVEVGSFSATCTSTKGDEVTVTNVTYDSGKSTEGHPVLQYIQDVEQAPAATWAIGLGYNLFGGGKVFAESVEYWNSSKIAYYGESNLETMEAGLELITTGTEPIEVPYMFGCTDYANQFGYVYWKDGEDPLTKKHYVLMEDARPEVNVYTGSWKGTSVGAKGLGTMLGEGSEIEQAIEWKDQPMSDWCHCTKGNGIWSEAYGKGEPLPMPEHASWCPATPHCNCGYTPGGTHQGWCPGLTTGECDPNGNCPVAKYVPGNPGSGIYSSAMAHNGCVDPMDTYLNASNQAIYGTSYRLMYFGDNGEYETGTYTFPAGYHIVFWIDKLGSVEDLTAHTGYEEGNFNYSIPELNERLGHTSPANGKKRAGGPNGIVKCITWTMDEVTYMGFGDNSGDEDLNDIVFITKGGAYPKNTVQMGVIKWHMNYEGTHDETDADLYDRMNYGVGKPFAQPDGTPVNGDLEFLGWSTTPTGATGYSKTITGTTTAETQCYFAIWRDNKVNIKWHMNLEGTHDTTDGDLYYSQRVEKNTGTYNKPDGTPTADGKTFLGWATEPDATEPNAFVGANPADATAGEEDVCYYAVWSSITPTPDPAPISWIFACEDLGGNYDYDFNDVVWEVQKTSDNKVQARLLAAGGTLGFTLKYQSTAICTKADVCASVKTVYETVSHDWVDVLTDADWTISENSDKFSVVVEGTTSTVIQAPTTKVPHLDAVKPAVSPEVLLVPGNWAWPKEGHFICDAYPMFKDWTGDGEQFGWVSQKVSEHTVK